MFFLLQKVKNKYFESLLAAKLEGVHKMHVVKVFAEVH